VAGPFALDIIQFVIHYVSGDILLSRAQAVAHGVALKDAMTQGLARSLHEMYPAMHKDYHHWCLLTDGTYDAATGLYRTPAGQTRYYMATDNLHEQRYVGLSPDDLVEIAVEQELHFHSPSVRTHTSAICDTARRAFPQGKMGCERPPQGGRSQDAK